MVITGELTLRTHGRTDVQDITGAVEQLLARSGVQNGLLTVFCPGSTGALSTIEYEDGAVGDLKALLDELIPADRPWQHNLTWDDGNGHSHLRATLMGPSITVPIVAGRLTLGTWQQIIFCDFDVRSRNRRLVVQIVGEGAQSG